MPERVIVEGGAAEAGHRERKRIQLEWIQRAAGRDGASRLGATRARAITRLEERCEIGQLERLSHDGRVRASRGKHVAETRPWEPPRRKIEPGTMVVRARR